MQKSFVTSYEYRNNSFMQEKLSEEVQRDYIKSALKQNKELYEDAKKQLVQIKKHLNTTITPDIVIPEVKKQEEITIEMEETTEYNVYWEWLKSCTDLTEIPEYLPKRTNENCVDIMNGLILMCLAEKKEANDGICEEALEEDYREMFQEEAKRHQDLINYLIEYRDTVPAESELTKEKIMNRLVYLPTSSGNPSVFNDLKTISDGYEESFMELIDSIKDGSFKGLKAFVSNSKLAGLLEVKNFKTRIVFKRLTKDIYIIYSMFMKDQDNDYKYRNSLVNHYEHWNRIEKSFKAKLTNPEFLAYNDEITAQIEAYLAGKELNFDGGFTRSLTRDSSQENRGW